MCVRGSKVVILNGVAGIRLPDEHGADLWYVEPSVPLPELAGRLTREWGRVDAVIHPVGADSRSGSMSQQAMAALAEIATHLSALLDRSDRAAVVGVHYGAAGGDWPAISNSSLEKAYSRFATAYGHRPARVGLLEAVAGPQSARARHALARALCRWTSAPVGSDSPGRTGRPSP